MKFVYKSRFKEDYTTGIDLRNELNNRVSINPLGALGKGERVPKQFDKDSLTIQQILDIAYSKFLKNMNAEEYPVVELRSLDIPKQLRNFKALKSGIIEGTVFIDKNNLYAYGRPISGKDLVKKHPEIQIDNRIEIDYKKHKSFDKDSVYIFEYNTTPTK